MTSELSGAADPFGLWTSVAAQSTRADESLSFDLNASGNGEGSQEEVVGSVWRINGPEELEARARRVHAVRQGLSAAEARMADFLRSQGLQGSAVDGNLSFDTGGLAEILPNSPESHLLLSLESAEANQAAVSFGLLDQLPGGTDWQKLQDRLGQLMDSVNRQLLNFAWVDTEMGGVLLGRTTINWGGDLTNLWLQQATPAQISLHCRSLALAIQSRQASLHTVTSVASIAGSLALAFTTPLGPVRLMALAWQFISEVLVPFLKADAPM